jgi:hypothetical protein
MSFSERKKDIIIPIKINIFKSICIETRHKIKLKTKIKKLHKGGKNK